MPPPVDGAGVPDMVGVNESLPDESRSMLDCPRSDGASLIKSAKSLFTATVSGWSFSPEYTLYCSVIVIGLEETLC